MVTIRVRNDGDSLHDITTLLHRAYARLGEMGLNYTAVDQSTEVTARRIGSGTCYLACAGRELVGTILVHPTYELNDCEYFTRDGVAAIHQFAVDPAWQGKGIGRALLHEAERWARRHGYRELAMDTAAPAGHLLALYRQLGYREVGSVQWPGKVYHSVVLSKEL